MGEANAVDIVSAFYLQVLSGEVEAAVATGLTPNVVWENPLPAEIPFGGRFEGREAAARYLAGLFEAIEIEAFDIDQTIAEGDHIVVVGRETSLVKKTGRRYSMGWVHVVRIRDGQLAHLREYNDTAAMAAAFGG